MMYIKDVRGADDVRHVDEIKHWIWQRFCGRKYPQELSGNKNHLDKHKQAQVHKNKAYKAWKHTWLSAAFSFYLVPKT